MFNVNNYFVYFLINLYTKFIEPYILTFARVLIKNNNTSLVSILIPTYDRAEILISRTLPSILNQTYENFEIIIIGDNSPKETVNKIIEFSNKFEKIKFINLSKRGNYPTDITNRWFVAGSVPGNKGLSLAKGEWIMWFDDDDVMNNDCIESLLTFAIKGNYEFVAGLYETIANDIHTIFGFRKDTKVEFGGHSTWLYKSYLKFFKYNINSWRKKWNRPADIDLQLRMLHAGVRMGSLEKVVVKVIPRPGLNEIGLKAHKKENI